MRILLAQINTTVGAFEKNMRRIHEVLDRARRDGVDLAIFPELAITGYPPKDLLNKPWFVEENLRRLDAVAALSDSLAAIVGYAERHDGAEGKGLYNAAALCAKGRVVSRHYKTLIPTYDVFDEGRYFDSAPSRQLAHFHDTRMGITICEDCWNDRLYWSRRLYSNDPVEELAAQGAGLLINISASPYNLGRISVRHDMFSALARRHRRPLVHVNLVGGNDGLLFDGSSAVFGPDGEILACARSFEEELLVFDTNLIASDARSSGLELSALNAQRQTRNPKPETRNPKPETDKTPLTTHRSPLTAVPDMEELFQALVMGTRDYVHKCHFEKVIVGLSGGIDSALTAAIAAAAVGPGNVYGVSMPSRYSSGHSKSDAASLAKNLGIDYRAIPIEPAFNAFLEMLASSFEGCKPDVAEENIQARIRGVTLMALSNKFGAMVLTTGNKSELAVGYATLYGDMCGGLAVIADVPKTMVYGLSRWINREREIIPQSSIDKPPSAELRPGQLDTDSLPPYEVLDPILRAYIEDCLSAGEIAAAQSVDRALVERVARMIDRNEYKRQQAAPVLRVTTKAFGYGRRMPIAAYD